MGKQKKSFDDLQAQIEKLVAQQEAMKDDKLNVLLETFKREFDKNKSFQQQVLKADNAVLKEVAILVIRNFVNFSDNAKRAVDDKKNRCVN